ncbi:MAG: pyrroloquinoline quinone biosynthesis peptide chaperone PqqD [Alphaproteobacteria bacterium]|nr:pyrroloquinoline quinone biosynthesis peptide chaperone PqqD [Alphaproteobacteria bacterium]
MSDSSPVDGGSILRFPPHVKFRFDETRQAWIVLAPERLLLPDDTAVEVLKLVDGGRDVDRIVDALAATFDAPREEIAEDVIPMLQDLVDKQVLRK